MCRWGIVLVAVWPSRSYLDSSKWPYHQYFESNWLEDLCWFLRWQSIYLRFEDHGSSRVVPCTSSDSLWDVVREVTFWQHEKLCINLVSSDPIIQIRTGDRYKLRRSNRKSVQSKLIETIVWNASSSKRSRISSNFDRLETHEWKCWLNLCKLFRW